MKTPIIDGHRHLICPQAFSMARELRSDKDGIETSLNQASVKVNAQKSKDWSRKMTDFKEHTREMAGAGIDMGVVWPPPTEFLHWTKPEDAAALTRVMNEYTAEKVDQYPNRLAGLAVLPMQDEHLAIEELTYAVKMLGLKGIALMSSLNGTGYDEERFSNIFKKIEALDIPIFIHPDVPYENNRLREYYLTNFVGFPMESTIAACQLVFGGVLDQCPDLKICLVHGGGALPFLLGRVEHGQGVRPESSEKCQHPFTYYLKNFYVDSVVFQPEILRFVISILPDGHVFLGTDYPFDMAEPDPVSLVKKATPDDPEAQEQLLGGTLVKLLKMGQ